MSAEFVPAVMLYRRSCATAHQARRRAIQSVGTGGRERRLREIDATVETIVLAQAAAEGWIHWAYHLAEVEPSRRGWIPRWQEAPRAIAGSASRELDEKTIETLRWLNAWRNYLVHNDAMARQRMETFVSQGTEVDLLTADTAEAVISRMDDAFTDIGGCIGWRTLPGLHSAFLWRAHDED
ncbi:hypothetical protein [Modestobacter altitudinis]|uniref:hypothetical protein n=1 Tax=Modestobacter altitudinis TaxID=2213158 RepID=UPI00110D0F4A|nr:hypothetical protein [Modestobacter altitudinis]